MDDHTQFVAYKCLRFCGLMLSASSVLIIQNRQETRDEALRLLMAGVAAVQQFLPSLEAFAQADVVKNPVRDSRPGESAGELTDTFAPVVEC
jgi:hypothetical protein